MNVVELEKIKLDKAGFFRYRKISERYLLTTETGEFVFLSEEEFKSFIEGALDKESLIYGVLDEKNFLPKNDNTKEAISRYRCKYDYLRRGTSLHIVIPTLRCNHRCIYCHAKAQPCNAKGYDMDKKTAKRVVDTIFKSPSPYITIEFQGGEPLLNWDILKLITCLAISKNRVAKKNLNILIVSNFTLLTEEKLSFLLKHKIGICTSLDGPKFIHDHNRPMIDGRSSYELTTHWLKRLAYLRRGYSNALVTVSRQSLMYPIEIINEYLKWGMNAVPLRPVSVLGYAGDRRDALGITAEEFLFFYRKALDYMVELNEITGERISERMAKVCLKKIFEPRDPSYLDMRSPCGAGCGQLAYFYDGSVYTCDEARMLGNDSFKLGNVHKDSYLELMQSKQIKAAVFASSLDGLYCDYCGYKPYCGVCPVVNWKEYGTLYAQACRSFICKVHKGMFDYLFLLLQDKHKAKILRTWVS